MRRLLLLISILFLLFTSCEKEQEPLPSYIEGLVELHADPSGTLRTLITEQGTSYGLLNPQSGYISNTVYRAYTIYTISSSGAVLYQLGIVPSNAPMPMLAGAVRQDPVELISLWKTQSRWLNVHVRMPAGEEKNGLTWGYICTEEKANALGTYKMLYLTLETKIQQAPFLYKQDYFSSCPLASFSNQLRRGVDSIYVTLNTEKGKVERKFVY